MTANMAKRFTEKPFGVPSGTLCVREGDLVQVTYLPVGMSHFDKCIGVVVNKQGKDFFINRIGKDGKLIPKSSCGWYSPENVTILVPQYRTTTVHYKPLPKNLKSEIK